MAALARLPRDTGYTHSWTLPSLTPIPNGSRIPDSNPTLPTLPSHLSLVEVSARWVGAFLWGLVIGLPPLLSGVREDEIQPGASVLGTEACWEDFRICLLTESRHLATS